MSKLKRKKSTVEDAGVHATFRTKDPHDGLRSHSSSAPERGPWWTASELTEPEKLWACVLQTVCPTFMDAAAVCCVPELPPPSTGTRRAEDREQAWCSLEGEVSVPLFPLAHSPRELPSHTPLAHSPGPDDSVHSTVHFPLSQRDRQPDTTERQSAAPTLRHLEASQRNCPSLWKQTETPDSANEVTEGREWRLDGITAIVAGGSLGNSGKSRGLEWGVGIKPHKQTSSSHNNGAAISEFADWQAGKGDGQESGRLFGSGIRMSRLERECPPKTGSPDIGTESGLETDAMVGKSEGSGPGLEGAGLECCPMCLMLFPEGFSQMECDSHLARCLSDMNGDMAW
ncbi:uncharacterized protein si:ch73-70k4.1 [Electrophorus electricus]|uniref:uncharacterized protein si:ch73-70k4.1 n=1 Tax=Electrophorus electricus TaxID=8005 RepID=UPI0015D0A9F8|nr:uncharacterized protein si:ch73-70k4.1 [Electrophorus electricus]